MAPPPKQIAPSGQTSPGEEGAAGPGNVINLMALNPAQLQQLKSQVEQELNFYQDAVVQLKDVQVKMQDAGNSVKALAKHKKELFLPLTPSVYCLGEVEDQDHVVVDIGTGYFVEKTIDEAIDYFTRKVDFLTTQIEKVQQVGREKTTIRGAITEVLNGKLRELTSQIEAQKKE